MSEKITCPRCGATLPPSLGSARETSAEGDDADFPEEDVEAVPLLASGSNDDAFRMPALSSRPIAVSPDPILGEYVPNGVKGRDPFPAIDLAAPLHPEARGKHPRASADDLIEGEPAPGTPWSTVLLASYASATTLALGWLLLANRGRDARPAEPPTIVDRRADPGLESSLSRVVEPPRPIPEDRVAAPGQTLAIGALEIKPESVRRQDILLQRFNLGGRAEQKAGGKDAFVVRLRLRNTSRDLAFAPIDQAFVRERGGVTDNFVETASGAKVYPYPLAVESEMSIVGQDFAPLRPGESRTVVIASAPDAPGDDQGPFLWRIRLRTGIDRTETIGVRWSGKTPGPAPARK